MIFSKYFNYLRTVRHKPISGGLEIFKYIGPGLIVTVGFIDPGNWAANITAGSQFGYVLLWVVTLSTIMLIVLQHNDAHLGIATGLCISEAATAYLRPRVSRPIIATAVIAAISTALAEILGAARGALEDLIRDRIGVRGRRPRQCRALNRRRRRIKPGKRGCRGVLGPADRR